MSIAWTPICLGDVVRIKHGFAFSGMGENADSSLPIVVGIGNFDYAGGFRFGSTTVKRHKGSYPDEFELAPGDVLLAMTCQTAGGEILGIPGMIPDDGQTYLHNQRLGKIEVTAPDRVHLPFLFQLARWRVFNRHLFATASGSKILHTSPGRIEDFEFKLPSIDEQRGIAAILAALDDKIAWNRDFLQLVPQLFRAKVLAASDKEPHSVAVIELADFVNGGAYTKDATGNGRMVIRIADLNSGPGGSTVYNDIEVPDDKTARPGDILMSWSGSLGVYRWTLEEAIVNQHIFKVLPKGYPAWLVFDRLDAVIHIFRSVAKDKATTMGHIQRGHLEMIHVDVPTQSDVARLDSDLSPLWDRLLVAEQETIKLSRLRDTLLPELLSRIRVPEAREVGQAL